MKRILFQNQNNIYYNIQLYIVIYNFNIISYIIIYIFKLILFKLFNYIIKIKIIFYQLLIIKKL